jgi:hypothetical protein
LSLPINPEKALMSIRGEGKTLEADMSFHGGSWPKKWFFYAGSSAPLGIAKYKELRRSR